jgi:hypothetical protein
LPCLIFLTFHLSHSMSLKTSLDNQPQCTDRVPPTPSRRFFGGTDLFLLPLSSPSSHWQTNSAGFQFVGKLLQHLHTQLFLQFPFNFPFCNALLLVTVFAAHSFSTMRKFWRPFEHNFPSHAFAFYFLSPRLILSYYSLPSPFVWPFSFNIPSCSSTPPPLLVNYSTLPKGRGEDRVQ